MKSRHSDHYYYCTSFFSTYFICQPYPIFDVLLFLVTR